ncbi:hypothetical protein ACPA9J_33935, partial [Pseudomonas aeruginosa]
MVWLSLVEKRRRNQETVRVEAAPERPRSLPLLKLSSACVGGGHAGAAPANPENARKASRELFAIRLKAGTQGLRRPEGLVFCRYSSRK